MIIERDRLTARVVIETADGACDIIISKKGKDRLSGTVTYPRLPSAFPCEKRPLTTYEISKILEALEGRERTNDIRFWIASMVGLYGTEMTHYCDDLRYLRTFCVAPLKDREDE